MPISSTFLNNLTSSAGVYQFLDSNKNVLYVGKARNLKKRVSQYFHIHLTDAKTRALMEHAESIKVIVTRTEVEALLLENNLIKNKRPRYNVLLKDDKSYPYLFLSTGDFPRLDFYRGKKNEKGSYFGPYPNASVVRKTIGLLQKLFKVRQCHDVFFKHRKRPCLQYHIDRCTAPCVNYVTKEEYKQQINDTYLFLEGKNDALISRLEHRMEDAAIQLDYERAKKFRDQIVDLRRIQRKQYVVGDVGDFDVIAQAQVMDSVCLCVLRVRGGHLLGSHEYFPHFPKETETEEILSSFLLQYYLNAGQSAILPNQIILNLKNIDKSWLEAAFLEKSGVRVSIISACRGKHREILNLALTNAKHALSTRLFKKTSYTEQLIELKETLHLDVLPKRIECFDISHSAGEETVASCVVFGLEGVLKSEYRRFNIKGITLGDDYAAMKQALSRRYKQLKEAQVVLPDLIMVDGGRGQLKIAVEVLADLKESVMVLAIAKGEGRKAGLETLWLHGKKQSVNLKSDSITMHLLQRIRDEAHRFALFGHQKRRDKKRTQSVLEQISGVGAARRRALLYHFGGIQELRQASVEEIMVVAGFNRVLAQRVYDHLHENMG